MQQQLDTEGGTIFVSLEDETGFVQVNVWESLRERQHAKLLRLRPVVGIVAACAAFDRLLQKIGLDDVVRRRPHSASQAAERVRSKMR